MTIALAAWLAAATSGALPPPLPVSLATPAHAFHPASAPMRASAPRPPSVATNAVAVVLDEEVGFVPLFDGRGFAGIRFQLEGGATEAGDTFRVRDGAIVCSGAPAGYWYTEGSYRDFTLRFEWRYARPEGLAKDDDFAGNSGYLLFITEHEVWPRSLEVQGMFRDVGTIIPIASKADFMFDREAQRRARKPLGEWNEMEIASAGGRVETRLNGVLVSTVTRHDFTEPGPIAFQSEGAEIHWRNVRIGPPPRNEPGGAAAGPLQPFPILVPMGRYALGAWESLFDGETLAGWTTKGGPYDGDAEWTVEDGAITGRQGPNHEGGLLYTERVFRDFEFECDVKIDWPFDSGVFLRMTPDKRGIQVTLDWRPGGEIGGLYSDGWIRHNPEGATRFERDSWNRLRISCQGDEYLVLATIDDAPLIGHRFDALPAGYASDGRIGLQVHGGEDFRAESKVQFRGIRVREATLIPNGFDIDWRGFLRPNEAGVRAGWRPLFDGKSLEGWEVVGEAEGFVVEDGLLVIRSGGGGHLQTTEDFRDFELRLDFRVGRGANSGVFLRAARDGSNPAFSGCEVQVLDDAHFEAESGATLQPWQFCGSLYGSVAPAVKDAYRPAPEWNTYEIRDVGTRLRIVLNGKLLYDVDTLAVPGDPPFSKRASTGFIGLQRHEAARPGETTAVAFRNVFVRTL